MKLKEVKISNYRSIESETFVVEEKDGSHTFTLIGVNESGKSSFLNAVALIDDGTVAYPKDFLTTLSQLR
jgi:predicted ATP-dependent endonuclease of OLD family